MLWGVPDAVDAFVAIHHALARLTQRAVRSPNLHEKSICRPWLCERRHMSIKAIVFQQYRIRRSPMRER